MQKLIELAQQFLSEASRAVALTGAGISTPSGIPDFRSPHSGLWEHADPFDVASIYSFRRRPADFYEWIHPLAKLVLAATPNPAHVVLAQLEAFGRLEAVITQNIDMLHSRAGSKNVIEIHGHMRELTCLRCFGMTPSEEILRDFIATGDVPHCKCGGVLKPNVILIGEQMPISALRASKQEAQRCDLMLVAGSSLTMAPAGDLPLLAKEMGARLIIINYQETHADHLADVVIHADVVEILPQLAAPFLPGG